MNYELLNHLENELPKIGQKIEDINYGGCGMFAYYLSLELTKRNIKHNILWLGEYDYEMTDEEVMDKFYDVLETTGDSPVLYDFHRLEFDMNHIVIEVDAHYIDCEGVFADTFYFQCGRDLGYISKKQLKSFVKNGGWNDIYDQTNNAEMYLEIKKVFKKFANIK